MQHDFASAAASARAAWRCNATIADQQWPLRQLHGLSTLLSEHRDELVSELVEESGNSTLVCERELGIVQLDLVAHMQTLDHKKNTKKGSKVTFGSSSRPLPCGTCLIIVEGDTPLRYGLGLLAAAIAARNATILATTTPSPAIALIRQHAAAHLDSFALHILVGIGRDHPQCDLDRTVISGRHPAVWSKFLENPKTTFVSSMIGYNLALVPEDSSINVKHVAQQMIANARASNRPNDGVDAILVHSAHYTALSRALSANWTATTGTGPAGAVMPRSSIPLAPGLLMLDATDSKAFDLDRVEQDVLEVARHASTLLLMKMTSLEQIVDVASRIGDLAAVTVFSTSDSKSVEYLKRWTSPASFASNFIPRAVPVAVRCPDSLSDTLFSTNVFSKMQTVHNSVKPARLDTIQDIREAYETTIPNLEPEHPGGRIDFFKQVEYTVKTAAAIVAAVGAMGAWYGVRSVSRRL